MRSYSRRDFLGLAAAGASAAMLSAATSLPRRRSEEPLPQAVSIPSGVTSETDVARFAAAAAPPPPPLPPPTRRQLTLMDGTPYATPVVVTDSPRSGPVVMVLGGVHGNEPGGWLAAEELARWPIERGTLIVAPRVNHLSAEASQRTSPALGDLNRLYPGKPDGLPMEQMAHEIVALARRHSVTHLLDLHESWGFYRERAPGNRSVSSELGQLAIAGGDPAETELLDAAARRVNTHVDEREKFIVYDRRHPDWTWIGLGQSSISLGAHIDGCTPILVETGQDGQSENRRAELHLLLLAATLEQLGMREPDGAVVELW